MKKKVISILLAALIILSTATTAFASQDWPSHFAFFQTLRTSYGNQYAGYTKPLQMFLICYNDGYASKIYNAGGVDGYYGTATKDCVVLFQQARGLSDDGICGPSTWRHVAYCLNTSSRNGYTYFSIGSDEIIRARNTSPYEFCYKVLLGGNGGYSSPFHSSVG